MASTAMVMEDRQEWATACDVQQRFMQHEASETDAIDCSAKCRQICELGGDCYDFAPLADGRLALIVGDASGKGLAAALMISGVQSSLRTAALFAANNVAAVIGAVNRHVYTTSLSERYATLFYGVFDGTTGTLHYVNAGHNPPMVMHPDGSVDWLEAGGAPVGMFPDWRYEEGVSQLDSGDLIVACTDGVLEAENPDGEQWGVESLRRVVAQNRESSAGEMVDSIFEALDEFSNGRLADDATVAVLRVR